jgi:hypothetical protein
MADNAQKLNFGGNINTLVVNRVLQHLQLQAGKAPATIVKVDKTNTILTLKFETDGTYTLPQVTVPVHGSEYSRFPYKKGDKGVVGAFDLDIGNMTGLGKDGPASFTRPFNLASLMFHPTGNAKFTPTDDQTAKVDYAPTGTVSRDTNKKSQVKVHPDTGAQIQGGGDGNGNYPHTSTASSSGVTHKSTSKVKTDAPMHDVTGTQTVGGDNNVTGNVTGSTGSFPNGLSGGGLSMLSGLISGAGGGGGITAPSLATGSTPDASGLQAYSSATAALAALGVGKFYLNTSLGSAAAQTIPASSGGTTTTIPATASFYSQGIYIVRVTG